MDILILLRQMVILLIVIIVGYVISRIGILKNGGSASLSRMVVYVFNPALIISSVVNSSVEDTGTVYITFLIAAVSYVFLIICGWVLGKIFGKEAEERITWNLLTVFANVGFMGIPVVTALYGTEKLIYVAIFILEYNLLAYTYGTFCASKDKAGKLFTKANLKSLVNVGTVACVIAFAVFLFRVPVPQVISQPLSYLGNCATPVSLLVLGISIAEQGGWKRVFTDVKAYRLSAFKLIAVPVIACLILSLFRLSPEIAGITLIMIAMPCGNLPLMLMKNAGYEANMCCNAIIMTTILSVGTIPLISLLYNVLQV
ncbi:MAG: AEC family transporter [Parasporobacterium sp.]|nr:AEC family transporter [Parasporobacterium sp.]